MELAALGHMRRGRDLDRFIQVRHEVVPKTSKHRGVEDTVRGLGFAGVARHQRVNETVRRLIPKQSAARIISGALLNQQLAQMQQVRIVARHSVDELGREGALLRRRQGQPGWLYADQQGSGVRGSLTCCIDAGGQHRQRALLGFMRDGFSGDAAIGRSLRHERDHMLMQAGGEMRRSLVFELDHLHAAFARRAARRQDGRRLAVGLDRRDVSDVRQHACVSRLTSYPYVGALAANPSIRDHSGARTQIAVPQECASGNSNLSVGSTDPDLHGVGEWPLIAQAGRLEST
jgi:hypothetical protein